MPTQEQADEAYKTGIALGLIEPPKPPDSEKLAALQKRLNDLEAERLFVAAQCSAAPSEPKLVIGGRVASGEEVLQAFKEMPKADRQSLLEDLRLLDTLEAEAQQNDLSSATAEQKPSLATTPPSAVRCSAWLDRKCVVTVETKMDKSVNRCIRMLKYLASTKRLSDGFLRLLNRLLLDGIEVKDVNLPARRTGMFLGIFAPQNYVELLLALVAVNRLCDREVPFHRRGGSGGVVLRSNEKGQR